MKTKKQGEKINKQKHKLRYLFTPWMHEGGIYQCDLCKKVMEVPIEAVTRKLMFELDLYC